MRKRVYIGRFSYLLDYFVNEIFVWMCNNSKTLQETLEYARKNNEEYHTVLTELMADPTGKRFIDDTLEKCDNKPYPEYLEKMRKARDDALYGSSSDNSNE